MGREGWGVVVVVEVDVRFWRGVGAVLDADAEGRARERLDDMIGVLFDGWGGV